jgi:hypothetical protein
LVGPVVAAAYETSGWPASVGERDRPTARGRGRPAQPVRLLGGEPGGGGLPRAGAAAEHVQHAVRADGQHPAGTAQPVRQVAARETLDHTIRLAFTNALNEIYLAAALLCLTLIRPTHTASPARPAKADRSARGAGPEWSA